MTKIMRKWAFLMCAAILCWTGGPAPWASGQGAKREAAVAGTATSNPAQEAGKAGDSKERVNANRAEAAAGDDIGIGLLGTLGLSMPSYDSYFTPSVWEGGKKAVAERDNRMRELKAFLDSRPTNSSPIQCLVGDAAYEAGGHERYQSGICIYYSHNINGDDRRRMASFGFTMISEHDWQVMRSWMSKAAAKAPRKMPRISDLWEAVVFSYYDGSRWRIAPWFYLSLVPDNRGATEADIAIFSLIEYVNCKLRQPIPFASYYRTHSILFMSEIRDSINEQLKQGRNSDNSVEEDAPDAKQEERPGVKIPGIVSK